MTTIVHLDHPDGFRRVVYTMRNGRITRQRFYRAAHGGWEPEERATRMSKKDANAGASRLRAKGWSVDLWRG